MLVASSDILNIKLQNINECEFSVTYTYLTVSYTDIIPTAVTAAMVEDGSIAFEHNVIKETNGYGKISYNSICLLVIDDREDNIRARILKLFSI